MTAGVQHRIYDDIHWSAVHASRYTKSTGPVGALVGGSYVHGASGHIYVANSDVAKGSPVDLSVDPEAGTNDWVRLTGVWPNTFDTAADLRAYVRNADSQIDVHIQSSDGGIFYWDSASTAVEDGLGFSGTVIKPNNVAVGDPGRYIREKFDRVNARWFIDPANGVDVANGLEQASAVAEDYDVMLYVPELGGHIWDIFRDITLLPSGVCDYLQEGAIRFRGAHADGQYWMTIGSAGARTRERTLKGISIDSFEQPDWSIDTCALRMINMTNCKIDIRRTNRGTRGAEFIGDSEGFVYNEITLGFMQDSQRLLHLTKANSGWCNENNFYGGRFGNRSSVEVGVVRYGVHMDGSSDTTNEWINNNVFHKPSFELQGGGVGVPVWIDFGRHNSVWQARSETNSDTHVIIDNDESFGNHCEFAVVAGITQDVYEDSMLVDNTQRSENTLGVLDYRHIEEATQSFSTGLLARNANSLSPLVLNSAFFIGTDRSTSNDANIAGVSAALTADGYLTFTGTIGNSGAAAVEVDVSVLRSFTVWIGSKSRAECGRVGVLALDESGNHIDARTDPYLRGGRSFNVINTYGGAYLTGMDDFRSIGLHVVNPPGVTVSKIWVFVTQGTAPAMIASINIGAKSTIALPVTGRASPIGRVVEYNAEDPAAGTTQFYWNDETPGAPPQAFEGGRYRVAVSDLTQAAYDGLTDDTARLAVQSTITEYISVPNGAGWLWQELK